MNGVLVGLGVEVGPWVAVGPTVAVGVTVWVTVSGTVVGVVVAVAEITAGVGNNVGVAVNGTRVSWRGESVEVARVGTGDRVGLGVDVPLGKYPSCSCIASSTSCLVTLIFLRAASWRIRRSSSRDQATGVLI